MLLGMATRSSAVEILGTLALGFYLVANAQNNDNEIQVYGSERRRAPKTTMVELHSNYTFQGSKTTMEGVIPTEHELHETVEITQGITTWFETGFYIFTAVPSDQGWRWVGDHIRPRVRAPDSWHWPVGVSLSTEFGYARPIFSTSVWSLEIRPIVDKQQGRLYWSINPALKRPTPGQKLDGDGSSRQTRRSPGASPKPWPSGWNTTAAWDRSETSIRSLVNRSSSFRLSTWMSRRSGRSTLAWVWV